MPSKSQQPNILERRKIERTKTVRKLKYLIGICVAILALFLVVGIAAIREGGFSNLTQGDKNIVLNTVENVSDSLTGNNNETDQDDPSKYNKPVAFGTTPVDRDQQTISEYQNEVVFSSSQKNYSIKVKKESYIRFINNTGGNINVDIDGMGFISLKDGEIDNVRAMNVGKFSFKDILDPTPMRITGTIEVVED